MNNITIELCAEDRARIDNLTAALEKFHDVATIKLTPEQTQRMADLAEQAGETLKPEPVAEAPKAEPTPEPVAPKAEEPKAEPTAEPVKEVTVEELRAKIMQLNGAGKKDAVRDIVLSYAPNVGSIPADKRAEVLKKLNALEG